MGGDEVRSSKNDRVLQIVFDRPDRRNALTIAMYEALVEALRAAAADPDVRVVCFRGSGGNFTAGNDLRDFARRPPTGTDSPVFRFLEILVGFEKPVVAVVEGHAIGIGTTMLMHCDLVYAADDARFQLPFVNLGLVPEAGSSYLLPRVVGLRRAAEMLMLGDRLDAPAALQAGLVNAVFPRDAFEREVGERLGRLADKPPVCLRETKRLLRAPDAAAVRERMIAEGALFLERLASPETAEAITAFFEKRNPDFSRFS